MTDIDYGFSNNENTDNIIKILNAKINNCINYRNFYDLDTAYAYYEELKRIVNSSPNPSKYDADLKRIKCRLFSERLLSDIHFDSSVSSESVLRLKHAILVKYAYTAKEKDLSVAKTYCEMAETYFDSFEPEAVEMDLFNQLKQSIEYKEKVNEILSLITQIEKDIKEKNVESARIKYQQLLSKKPGSELQSKLEELYDRINKLEQIKKTEDESLKTFYDQKEAYENEIDRIKQLIERNDKNIYNLEIDIHNLGINTFGNKLDLRFGATFLGVTVSLLVSVFRLVPEINISLKALALIMSGTVLGSNLLLTRITSKNKKLLKKEFKITKEREVQDKKLDLEIQKQVLEDRNEMYKLILERLEIEYNHLCNCGIPYDFKHEINNEEEMNTNNIRSTKMIKNSIYSLEAELEKNLRETDKLNETNSLNNIQSRQRLAYEFGDSILYFFTPYLFSMVVLLFVHLFDITPKPGMFFAAMGLGAAVGSLKVYSVRSRIRAIKRKLEELKIVKHRYKEVYERKETKKRKQLYNNCMNIEKQLIKENSDLKYSERKKKEFEESHKELFREDNIEQKEEKPMLLKMN